MAGVIAHSREIVSSANARVLVTLMSVLLSVTAANKDNASDYNVSPLWTTTAVTAITALKAVSSDHQLRREAYRRSWKALDFSGCARSGLHAM
jgi:hypothetical protein